MIPDLDLPVMDFDSSSSIISLFEDDESRWQAVVNRNPNADGFFIYAVKTTKVYCRPICKARLARRSNIRFFNNSTEAAEAGFRACKRCKPDLPGFMPEESAVQKIRVFVASRANGGGGDDMMSLSQMAKQTGLSKWHFHRVFKKCVGMTPTEYLREERLARQHRGEGFESQEEWMRRFEKEAFDLDASFSWFDDDTGAAAAAMTTQVQAQAPITTDVTTWAMDEFVSWPEEDTRGAA